MSGETITSIEPIWIDEGEAIAIHDRQLAEHGGDEGLRDQGTLQSAMARPLNAYHYAQEVSLSKLAACYAYGLAKNHAFIDGNKRTAWVVARTFLILNGYGITASKEEKYKAMYKLAAGDLSEAEFAAWLESKLVKRP